MIAKILASPWTRRLARWLGYPAFYSFAMLVFVRCTFPYDRLGDRAVSTFNESEAKRSGRRVEIETVRGSWLFGVGLHGVRVVSPPVSPGEDGKPVPERAVELDYARASVSPLRLLFGTLRVAFAARAGDGSMRGTFASSVADRRLHVGLEQFGLGNVPLLADTVGLPLLGVGTGEVDLAFAEQRLSLAEGTIELVVDDVVIGDGKTKLRDFIALPAVHAGQLSVSAEVTEGRVKITRFEAKGPDLELTVRGQIRLRDTFEKSLAELTLDYQFSEQYKSRNEMTKGLFGDPKTKMTGLLDLDPKVQRAKTPDGGYSWRISGAMAKLSFQPAAGGRPASAARSRAVRSPDPDDAAEE